MMSGSKKSSPFTSSLIALGTALSLGIAGCVSQQQTAPSSTRPIAFSPASPTAVSGAGVSTGSASAQATRYDWSTDRILRSDASFRTAAFTDDLKASLDFPSVEQQAKNATTSGGFANEFAKNLPGVGNVDYLPNSPSPAVVNNTAYFLTASESSTNFYALSENGQVVWQLSLHNNGGRFVGTAPALGSAGGNVLYALTDQGRLYAVNAATGVVRSFTDISNDTFENTSPFVIAGATDSIYLASNKGRIYKFTFNGSSFSADSSYGSSGVKPVSSGNTGRFSSSPLVTGLGGYIFIGSEEGKFYKLNEGNGSTVSTLNLDEQTRSEACQVKATPALDINSDAGLVTCGAYLFKIDLNYNSSTNMAFLAQSPLLELPDLTLVKPTQVLGPNFNNRTLASSTIARNPLPTTTGFTLDQPFGFRPKDVVKIVTRNGLVVYGQIDTLNQDAVTLGSDIFPLPSPSPDPVLVGGEEAIVSNLAALPVPTPTPTATPVGADPVTHLYMGNADELTPGDALIFPTLPNSPIAEICSSSNADCDSSASTRYTGLELQENDDLVRLTFPGTTLGTQITNALATDKFVPFEKVQNRVMGAGNSTIEFQLGSVSGFQAGNVVRVTHRNGSTRGRYEYGVVSSVDSANRRLRLMNHLADAPLHGDRIDIVTPNNGAYGRVGTSNKYSAGNILSSPMLRGNGQHVYVQHGNTLFQLDYGNESNFREEAVYTLLQSARLDQSNTAVNAMSRSVPLIVNNDKILTVDSDPSGKTGIFMNRVLLPLSASSDRLNDVFPIKTPNSLGDLPNRAETRPILFGSALDFAIFGGGNGIVYKLHKDIAW